MQVSAAADIAAAATMMFKRRIKYYFTDAKT
jgi:hypothetical protein